MKHSTPQQARLTKLVNLAEEQAVCSCSLSLCSTVCPIAPIGFRFLVHSRHSLDQSRQGQELSPCIADPRLGKRVPPRTERCSPICWSLPLRHAYSGDFVLCLQRSFVTFRCVRGLIHTRSCVPLRQWSTRRKTVQSISFKHVL